MFNKKVNQKGPVSTKASSRGGFTLIEILVVIGLIAILAAIVLIAINPAKQFAQARNTTREAAVNTLLNGIGQRVADNKEIFAGAFGAYTCPALPAAAADITSTVAAGNVDLSCLVPTYIPSQLPVDPTGGTWTSVTSYDAIYTVVQDAVTGRVTVCANNHAETSIPGSAAYCLTR